MNPKRKGPDMTDFLALANEAICYEGSDTYLGATSEQLADMLAANQDLWTPATDDTPWSIDDEGAFMAALAAHLYHDASTSAARATVEVRVAERLLDNLPNDLSVEIDDNETALDLVKYHARRIASVEGIGDAGPITARQRAVRDRIVTGVASMVEAVWPGFVADVDALAAKKDALWDAYKVADAAAGPGNVTDASSRAWYAWRDASRELESGIAEASTFISEPVAAATTETADAVAWAYRGVAQFGQPYAEVYPRWDTDWDGERCSLWRTARINRATYARVVSITEAPSGYQDFDMRVAVYVWGGYSCQSVEVGEFVVHCSCQGSWTSADYDDAPRRGAAFTDDGWGVVDPADANKWAHMLFTREFGTQGFDSLVRYGEIGDDPEDALDATPTGLWDDPDAAASVGWARDHLAADLVIHRPPMTPKWQAGEPRVFEPGSWLEDAIADADASLTRRDGKVDYMARTFTVVAESDGEVYVHTFGYAAGVLYWVDATDNATDNALFIAADGPHAQHAKTVAEARLGHSRKEWLMFVEQAGVTAAEQVIVAAISAADRVTVIGFGDGRA